jgi:hypothetical protein
MTQYEDNPSYAYCTKYVITAVNKQRTPINCAAVRGGDGSTSTGLVLIVGLLALFRCSGPRTASALSRALKRARSLGL